MKKTLISILLTFAVLGTTSVYGQWTTTGTNVGLDPTNINNNVVVGPTPAAPTQLHLNGIANPNLVLSLENTAASYPNAIYTGIQFKGAGLPFELYTDMGTIGCGYNMFHLKPIGSGAGIHFQGNKITFSDSPKGTLCGNSFGDGKYVFDGIIGTSSGVNIGYHPAWMSAPTGYQLTNSGNSYFRGKVLIGTTSTTLPTSAHKLYVGGSIICEELVVKLQANWADYVFAPSYKLMSLTDVKTFIAANSHLPGVPAASEIAETGIATGDMLTIQMKKIEELTLYLIQMQEQNEALIKRLDVLESK